MEADRLARRAPDRPRRGGIRPALGGYAYRTAANSWHASFKERSDARFLRLEIDGRPVDIGLDDAGTAAAAARGNAVTYPDARPGTDLSYHVGSTGLKEAIVLRDASAPASYRFRVAAPEGGRLTAHPRPGGSWLFRTGAAGRGFTLAAPFATDATPLERRGGSVRVRRDRDPHASMSVTRDHDGYVVDVRVDEDWLRAPGRRFPVTVDPTITIQPSAQSAEFLGNPVPNLRVYNLEAAGAHTYYAGVSPVLVHNGGACSPDADDPSKTDTLRPGPHAGEGVDVPTVGMRPTREMQAKVDRDFAERGCHTCGTRDSGKTDPKSSVFDHQPATRFDPPRQRGYGQCLRCSRRQGGPGATSDREGVELAVSGARMSRRRTGHAVSVDAGDLVARTDPIGRAGDRALVARVADPSLLEGAADLLTFVLGYVEDARVEVHDGETFQYGYWSLRFTAERDGLALWERSDDYSEYVPGTDHAVRAWTSQWRTCAELGSAFDPPRADGIAVAAKDILTAPRFDAIRYEAGQHTTGWWCLTDSYMGESDQLAPQHLHHITVAYPELTRFLALDVGWVAHWDGGRMTPYRESPQAG